MNRHNRTAGDVRGLTSSEAARRLVAYGPNALPESSPLPWWVRVGRCSYGCQVPISGLTRSILMA